jgi:hypothetical protein
MSYLTLNVGDWKVETTKFNNVEAHVVSVISITNGDGDLELTVHVENPDRVPTKGYLFHMIKDAIEQHMLG